MGTISIHGLSSELEEALKEKAKENHQSISGFVKELIETSLSKKAKENNKRQHFEQFIGKWTEAEYQEFNNAISDFDKIDPQDWQ
jgi:hypothetical protein